ncbi:hypothetical protein [Nocardia sp. IFM 10818]
MTEPREDEFATEGGEAAANETEQESMIEIDQDAKFWAEEK